jgi:hypothetical protein
MVLSRIHPWFQQREGVSRALSSLSVPGSESERWPRCKVVLSAWAVSIVSIVSIINQPILRIVPCLQFNFVCTSGRVAFFETALNESIIISLWTKPHSYLGPTKRGICSTHETRHLFDLRRFSAVYRYYRYWGWYLGVQYRRVIQSYKRSRRQWRTTNDYWQIGLDRRINGKKYTTTTVLPLLLLPQYYYYYYYFYYLDPRTDFRWDSCSKGYYNMTYDYEYL